MTSPLSPPDSEYISMAQTMAARVLYELLGRRWVWPAVTTTETIVVPPWPDMLILAGRPVQSIASVTEYRLGVDPVVITNYTLVNGHCVHLNDYVQLAEEVVFLYDSAFLWFPGEIGRPFDIRTYSFIPDRRFEVVYTYGSPPPPQVAWAIDVYANELKLAMEGSSDCRLPQRVTSVSRQGVSMSIADPTQYIEKGLTGIPEVDQVIGVFNPSGAKRPARVYSFESPPPRRKNTTQAPS